MHVSGGKPVAPRSGELIAVALIVALVLGGCQTLDKNRVTTLGAAYGPSDVVPDFDGVVTLDPSHPVAQAQSQPAEALAGALERLEDETLPVEERTWALVLATSLARHQDSFHRALYKTAVVELSLAARRVRVAPEPASVTHLLAAYDALLLTSPSSDEIWSRTEPLIEQFRGTGIEHRIIGKLAVGFPELSVQAATQLGGANAPVARPRITPPDYESFEDPDEAAEVDDDT